MEKESVLIVGASARAAAFSAKRARLKPVCIDLFADRDLAAWCEVTRVSGNEYPGGIELAARHAPMGPWVYVGALENYPELVGRMASQRPLWGNGPGVLRRVRDPFQIAGCLAQAGLPHPRVLRAEHATPPGEGWLVKPLAGAGGRGVRECSVLSTQYSVLGTQYSESGASPHYLQQRIDGVTSAAVFVADGRRSALLGLTQQLVGEPALCARPFHYCGSIGPLTMSTRLRQSCEAIGAALAGEFGLTGLFGVDAICRDDELWPVEVNPRYTASMEIVEHWLGVPLMRFHRDACLHGILPDPALLREAAQRRRGCEIFGKAILFARAEMEAPNLVDWLSKTVARSGRWPLPLIADVPRPGTVIREGHPMLSVFSRGKSTTDCKRALIRQTQSIYAMFLSAGACG